MLYGKRLPGILYQLVLPIIGAFVFSIQKKDLSRMIQSEVIASAGGQSNLGAFFLREKMRTWIGEWGEGS